MSIDKNAFYKYNETRALAGYRSAWLVKHPNTTKFSLIGATESVPYVFGDKGTLEFNLLQSPVIGQVEDKSTLEAVEIEVLHHRDNAYRYEKLKGQTLEFMSINAEMVGYKFVGTLDYRPNTAESDVHRATVTVTPMSAQATPVYDARPYILEPLCYNSNIPATIKVGDEIDLSVAQITTPTVTAVKISGENNTESDATSSLVTTNIKEVTISTAGLYAITVSDSAEQYASWTTTVYVESAN